MRRSPQEKKTLSYAKDRRSAYGESDKGSRRAIPRHKADVNRSNRRAASTMLEGAAGGVDLERADAVATSLAGRRPKRWRKWPGPRLDEHVARVRHRRATFQQMHGRSVKQLADGLARRGALATDEQVLAAGYSRETGRTGVSAVLTDQALHVWDAGGLPVRIRLTVVRAWRVDATTLILTTTAGRQTTVRIDEDHGLLTEWPAALAAAQTAS